MPQYKQAADNDVIKIEARNPIQLTPVISKKHPFISACTHLERAWREILRNQNDGM